MIKRYQSNQFKNIWSDQNRYDTFLEIELAVAKAWQILGLYDQVTFDKLSKAHFKLKDIYALEKETKHDVIAFTRTVGQSLGDEKMWLHYGLTSTDVVDSALALMLRACNVAIRKQILKLLAALKSKALTYKYQPIIGRTHGIHAEVTSFGLKFALWYADLKRLLELFDVASKNIEVIKISGAVGNYAANSPDLEQTVSKILNIPSADISTQVLQRDRHANYINCIALLGSQLEKISSEIRHLSRTEVSEVNEFFSSNQKGSSAMPHKKNPVASENISGLSRVLRGYTITAFENINLWHERDISHSSAERIIFADATTLIDYMLQRTTRVITNLEVHTEKMNTNIFLTKGIVFSQRILSLLIQKGFSRESAYDLIQKLSMQALAQQLDFKDLLHKNDSIKAHLSDTELEALFDSQYNLRHVDVIYKKVFA
jgi:adenylosuccinate lyase